MDVLVLEDDAFTRLSIVSALRHSGITVVTESGVAGEAVIDAERTLPHVAVLDLHLGKGPTGIDVARSLRRNNPRIGIVMLTSYDDPRLLDTSLPALPAGTQYVTKKSVTDVGVLVDAINASLSATAVRPSRVDENSLAALTDVQVEILAMIAEGASNQEIAKRRFTSEKSVEATIARIARTLKISKDATSNQRVQLTLAYLRARGIDTGSDGD
jgi:DNA-binding NarL/FixJ family response regulator